MSGKNQLLVIIFLTFVGAALAAIVAAKAAPTIIIMLRHLLNIYFVVARHVLNLKRYQISFKPSA